MQSQESSSGDDLTTLTEELSLLEDSDSPTTAPEANDTSEVLLRVDSDSPTTAPETDNTSDTVSQTGVTVGGESPAIAEAELSQSLSLSTSSIVQNAVNMQQQLTITHQANTNQELRNFLFPKLRVRHK